MRTLNIRLAAVLLAIAVVFGGGVYWLHGFQVKRNAKMLLAEADRAEERSKDAAEQKNSWLEDKEFKAAVRCLGWYVQLMPDKVEVRERLGILLAKRVSDENVGNRIMLFRQALGQLETTVGLDPSRKDARKELVKLTIMAGRFQDAKEHLQFLLQASPNDPEFLEQLGQCQLQSGDYDAAKGSFLKAIESGTDQVTSYWQLAVLLQSHYKQPKEADQWMDKLVEANPKSYMAHLLRGRYLFIVGRRDDALQEALKALELAPDDLDVLVFAATCHRVKGQLDEARRCVTHGIQQRPDAVVMYNTLAEIEKLAGNRDGAVAALTQGLKATNRNVQLLWALADMLIDFNRVEDAQRIIKELQSKALAEQFAPFIDYLQARTEFVQGHWPAAIKGFEKVRGTQILNKMANQIDVWIGQCYGQLGNRDQQMKYLRGVLNRDPNFIPAKAAMVDVNLARGDVGEAIKDFLQLAGRVNITPGNALLLARMLYTQNMRLPPERRNWQAVEQVLAVVEKGLPDLPDVTILRAQILLAQDRAADAEKLLLEARDKDRKQPAFWRALTSLAEQRGDWDRAEKLLKEADELFGDTTERRTARAQHLVHRLGKEAVEPLRKLADNTAAFSDDQLLQLWGGLLTAAMQVNDAQQIDLFCNKIAEKQPNNVNIRYLLFERALAADDQPAMEKALKEIERVAGQGSYWLYGQAVMLYLRGRDEKDGTASYRQALNYLARARELREDWSRIPLVEAGVFEALGMPDKALEDYLKAIDLGERNPNGLKRAIILLVQKQQFNEADQLIRQLEREQSELSPELIKAAAEISLQLGDFDRALEKARKGVPPDSKNYLDHVWQGQILGVLGSQAKAEKQDAKAAGLFADAEKALRRAAELEPKLPLTWVALVRYYNIIGEVAKAEKAIEELKKNIPEKESHLPLAQCYEAMHKTEEAEKQYEVALEAAPKDVAVARVVADFYRRAGKPSLAEALLKKIIDGKVSGKASDVAWARQQLALIYAVYAARGGYDYLVKARKLIEQNLASPEASAIDKKIKARLDASDPQKALRDQAMAVLEKLIEDQAATPEDQFMLAKMYDAANEWIKASNLYRNLVANNLKEPRYLVAYIEALLRHNETSGVEMYLERLKAMAPKWFVTLALEAELFCAEKQPERAFDLLKKFVDEADAQSKDRDARLRLAADQLVKLRWRLTQPDQKAVADKFTDQAESWYRAYAKDAPERNLVLAVFLGSRGKNDEALNLLEQSLNTSAPQDFSQACILLSHAEKTTEDHARRLDLIIDKAVKKYARHPALLLALAELRTRQTRYAESESLYREVLEKNPRHAVAMNNLAVLLALQGLKLDESLKQVNKAIEIAGPLGAMLDSRASVYMALNQPQKAIQDLTAAVADAETPVRLFHLAQAYKQAGQDDQAKMTMKKALEKRLSAEMLQPLELPSFEKMRKEAEVAEQSP